MMSKRMDWMMKLMMATGLMKPPGGIPCDVALARVNEFLDGELDPSEAESVETHFEVCTRCYPHLKLERQFRAKVQEALRKPEVPEGLRGRVLELLAQEGGQG